MYQQFLNKYLVKPSLTRPSQFKLSIMQTVFKPRKYIWANAFMDTVLPSVCVVKSWFIVIISFSK